MKWYLGQLFPIDSNETICYAVCHQSIWQQKDVLIDRTTTWISRTCQPRRPCASELIYSAWQQVKEKMFSHSCVSSPGWNLWRIYAPSLHMLWKQSQNHMKRLLWNKWGLKLREQDFLQTISWTGAGCTLNRHAPPIKRRLWITGIFLL